MIGRTEENKLYCTECGYTFKTGAEAARHEKECSSKLESLKQVIK